MKKLITMALVLFALIGAAGAQNKEWSEEQQKLLKPYPEASEGMVRYVLFLDVIQDEGIYKVELIPGKIMNVDCNRHLLMGSFEEKIVEGWGYPYFEFSTDGMTRSTRMACHTPNEDRFVQSESLTIRYNSKLPIVVYLPMGYDVLYRIWEAGELMPF